MKQFQFIFIVFAVISLSQNVRASSAWELYADGEVGAVRPAASAYLGTRTGGQARFRFVTTGDHLDYDAGAVGFRYDLGHGSTNKYLSDLKLIGRIENGKAHQAEDFPTLTTGGSSLIVPGTGVGSAGVGFEFLANNDVTNARFTGEHDYYQVMLGVEKSTNVINPSLTLKPMVGVEYTQSITENSFSGDVPFFVRSFDYDTKTKIHTVSPVMGLEASYDLNKSLSFFTGGHFAIDFNEGNGTDMLKFTGFADQTALMSKYEATPRYDAYAGIKIAPHERVTLSLQGNYKRVGNVPVTNNRDGNTISDIAYEKANFYSGSFRATFKY